VEPGLNPDTLPNKDNSAAEDHNYIHSSPGSTSFSDNNTQKITNEEVENFLKISNLLLILFLISLLFQNMLQQLTITAKEKSQQQFHWLHEHTI